MIKRASSSTSEFSTNAFQNNMAKFASYHQQNPSEVISSLQTDLEGYHFEVPVSNLAVFQNFQSTKNRTSLAGPLKIPKDTTYNTQDASIAIYSDRNLSYLSRDVMVLRGRLKILDISRNDITEFPSEVFEITGLEALKLDHNKLKKLPSNIVNLTKLEYLSVSYNELEAIPNTLGNLQNFKCLDIEGNFFTTLPKEVTSLTNLRSLNILYNKVTEFPTHFGNLQKLSEFSFEWFRYIIPQIQITQKGNEGEHIIKKLQNKCMELNSRNIRYISFEEFLSILSYQRIEILARDIYNRSLLHTATIYGDTSIANYFAANYPYLLDQEDQDGMTPICLALLNNKPLTVSCLLNYRVDPFRGGGKHGSILHIAVKQLNVQAVRHVLKTGDDPNRIDSGGNSPLHYAVANMIEGHSDAVKIAQLLLDHGANPNVKNRENWTPLHLAIRKKNVMTLEWIISHNFEVKEINGHGELFKLDKQGGVYSWTPLHIATYADTPELINALIQGGVDPFKRSLNGFTAKRIVKRFGLTLKMVEKYEKEWIKNHIKAPQSPTKDEKSLSNLHSLRSKREYHASKNIFRELFNGKKSPTHHFQHDSGVGFGNIFKTRMAIASVEISGIRPEFIGDAFDINPELETAEEKLASVDNLELQFADYCSELNEDAGGYSSVCHADESTLDKKHNLPDTSRQQPKQFFKGKTGINNIQSVVLNIEVYDSKLGSEVDFTIDFCREEIKLLSHNIVTEKILYSDKLKSLAALRMLQRAVVDYIYKNFSVPFPRECFSLCIRDYLNNPDSKSRMQQISVYYDMVPQGLIAIYEELLEDDGYEASHVKQKICSLIEEMKYFGGIEFLQNVVESKKDLPSVGREAQKCLNSLKAFFGNEVSGNQSKQAYHKVLKNQYSKMLSTKKHQTPPLQQLEKLVYYE